MCGITLTISPSGSVPSADHVAPLELHDSLAVANSSRGPNSHASFYDVIPTDDGGSVELRLSSCVLGLRGEHTPQPLISDRGVLAWNGQVFDGWSVGAGQNDTRVIFELLEAGARLEDVLADIEGPYACVYYARQTRTLTFQVDPLSRRSLLLALPTPTSPNFCLTSTRSAHAREHGVTLRALLGAEGGSMHLDRISMARGSMDLSEALKMRPCLPGPSNWIQTRAINAELPVPGHTASQAYAEAEVERFEKELLAAVRARVENAPQHPQGAPRIAVLFSGGVDCSLLAVNVHLCLPPEEPIELVNVAFQRSPTSNLSSQGQKGWTKKSKLKVKGKGKARANNAGSHSSPLASPDQSSAIIDDDGAPTFSPPASEYDTPDRLSGYAALSELRTACPSREWRFVEVNVTYEEYHEHRQRVIDLMYPAATEMDLSLAYPLYFASRGSGFFNGEPYTVRAKVYLSGLGADEQLGGYARHRHAYHTTSFPGLIDSLQTDLLRLPERNTSRDDRLLSSFARDARYPYLSLRFIEYLSDVPIWAKVCYELEEGWGDKLLLRLAADRAGMKETARRVKRAMQFGSRSAKVDGGVKGKAAGMREIT